MPEKSIPGGRLQRPPTTRSQSLSHHDGPYDHAQNERLQQIRQRLVEARRELDALIGDAYLRPRANIVPVHFLDLAAAVEKLRWAEKEWRELDKEAAERDGPDSPTTTSSVGPAAVAPAPVPAEDLGPSADEGHRDGTLVEAGRAQSSAR